LGATTTDIEAYFDVVELVQTQASATATYADAVHTDAYASTEENAIAYSKTTAATGKNVYQSVSVVFELNRNAFGNVTDNAVDDGIKLTNAVGNYDQVAVGTAQNVAGLVAALDGNTQLGSGTKITAAQDSFNEGEYLISWTSSTTGVAATASVAGSVYFEYGTDPTTGAKIVGTTGNVTTGGTGHNKIATLIATALNAATNAYVATATNNKLLIAATVSGTTNTAAANTMDRGPLSHTLQTLSIGTTVLTASGSLLWAGELNKANGATSGASNLTAAASNLYNLAITKTDRSGLRVTLRNNSLVIADGALAATEVAQADTMTARPIILAAGGNMTTSALNSSVLDYVAGFSDVQSQVAASTTSVNRVSWLGS
jgi:hypothetical protein